MGTRIRFVGKAAAIASAAIGVFIGSTQSAQAVLVQWSSAVGGNDHFYEVVSRPDGITWDAANLEAQAAGGHLVTLTTSDENNFVHSLIVDSPEFWIPGNSSNTSTFGPWIGAFQPPGNPEPAGGFEWVTGEPFVFTNWTPGDPNNAGGIEDVVFFFGFGPANFSATWADLSADATAIGLNNPIAYIIEFTEDPNSVPEPSFPLGFAALLAIGAIYKNSKRKN